MTQTDQSKLFFWELHLTPEQQERLAVRLQRAIRKAARKAWSAAE